MKTLLSTALVGLALAAPMAGSALAQTPPASNSMKPAISVDKADSGTTAAPVAGKNSFTESQVRDRLQKHGYTTVSGLALDDKSIWHGKAVKDGKPVDVAIDYQGNIVTQ